MDKKIIFILAIFSSIVVAGPKGPGASGGFINIKRRLLLAAGTISSAKENNAITNMFPCGDGTYYFKTNLIMGGTYNFIFQSKVYDSWQWEQLPQTGTFPASVKSNSVTIKQAGKIIKINGDVRRCITIPTYGSGTNFYIFCNYGHHPNPPELIALSGNQKVTLRIKSKGRWGNPEPDVELGGKYRILWSTSEGGPYTLLTNLNAVSNNYVTFTHTGLTNGKTYYYVAMSIDCYKGPNKGPFDKEVPVPDNTTLVHQEEIDAKMFSGYCYERKVTPMAEVPVIFKVQGIDWDYVSKNDNIVWLTPYNEDARFYLDKIQGRIVKVTLK